MSERTGGKMPGMPLPQVRIVTPALPAANDGNGHTAARWLRFLKPIAQVQVALDWQDDEPADALIALHARRSAAAIARFHARHPHKPLALVLTGTDLYRDLEAGDESARHSLECATHVVVLQEEALQRLAPALRAKTRVIVQSAARVLPDQGVSEPRPDFIAVGHLRPEKDPLTLMQAVALLAERGARPRVMHIGRALDESLAEAARRTMAQYPNYQWLGALDAAATRALIARAQALVHMSRMEGGANVVIEAVRSRVPVLASRIDGNLGLLGHDYAGTFPAGDAPALAALMQRFLVDADFAGHVRAQCAAREAMFRPALERAAVQTLLRDMVRGTATIDLVVSPSARAAP